MGIRVVTKFKKQYQTLGFPIICAFKWFFLWDTKNAFSFIFWCFFLSWNGGKEDIRPKMLFFVSTHPFHLVIRQLQGWVFILLIAFSKKIYKAIKSGGDIVSNPLNAYFLTHITFPEKRNEEERRPWWSGEAGCQLHTMWFFSLDISKMGEKLNFFGGLKNECKTSR